MKKRMQNGSAFPGVQHRTIHREWVRLTCVRLRSSVKSGRWDSNPRRPAWEAGILPLNYARMWLILLVLRRRLWSPSPVGILYDVLGNLPLAAHSSQILSRARSDSKEELAPFGRFP